MSAHFKYDEQDEGKDQQAAEQTPARMQDKLVKPAPPAFTGIGATRTGDVFKKHGGAMMTVSVHFFRKWARSVCSACARACAISGDRAGKWVFSACRK